MSLPDPTIRMWKAPIPFDPSDEETVPHDPSSNGPPPPPKPPSIPARSIDSFSVPADDDPSILLGNRYLCRGDGLILASASGMGKSALVIQAAVHWALGHAFMGVRPNGCLRSLIFQSEDSDGDIAEVWASILHEMKLTNAERILVAERVVIVSDRVNRGDQFMVELLRHVRAAVYDLVWINPLAAFITGDGTTQEATAKFLREGLNGINTPPRFAYIIVQHTTKQGSNGQGKERPNRKWFEIQYDMAGSYDLIGWARAIMSLRPTDTIGDFNLILAKRGRRAGVTKKVPQGVGYRLENTIIIPIKHSSGKFTLPHIKRELDVIYWEAREEIVSSAKNSQPERGGRPAQHTFDDFKTVFPCGRKNGLGFRPLHRIASELKPVGRGAFDRILDDAVAKSLLVRDTSDPTKPCYYTPEK